MKLISILLIPIFFIFSPGVQSQTVYHFNYNFQQADDQTDYQALFILFEDGTALARIKYIKPSSGNEVKLEMNMREFYVTEQSGMIDTSRVYYKSTGVRFISADDNINSHDSLTFIFKTDPSTGFIEPFGVTANVMAETANNSGTKFTGTYYSRKDLNPDFIKQFISPDEAIYKSFFPLRSRGLTDSEKETKMYLLVVANILDEDIGEACIKDTQRIVESFKEIALKMGLLEKNVIIKTITGDQYNRKNVELAIKNLKPVRNRDIVVFYYSGHGFRKTTERKISRYPYLDLRSKADSNYMVQSLNIEKDIYNKIVSKGARFNLVLGDCCNTYVPLPKVEAPPPPRKKGSGFLLNPDNCKTLFMENRSILACAADSNQLAAGNRRMGSFFSYFFKNSLENYCSIFQKDVSWDKILDETFLLTIDKAKHTYCSKPHIPANICDQKPISISFPDFLRQ